VKLQELNHHFELRRLLKENQELIAALRASAEPGAQALTGMPHSSEARDKVGDLAVEIADLEERIRFLTSEIKESENYLNQFFNTIENSQTRLIFQLRFLRGCTWHEVAAIVGGRNTEASIKSVCYRYLESCNDVLRSDA
jgi:predicted nuclease with TOPRIM domain